MQSIFDASARKELLDRFARLTPETPRRWGTMTAGRMVAHVGDQLRMAIGDIPPQPIPGFLRLWPMKYIATYVMPWPGGKIKAPPEGFVTDATDLQNDIATVRALFERLGASASRSEWPDHPQFGHMTGKLWGHLCYRHTDHHLRQFGV